VEKEKVSSKSTKLAIEWFKLGNPKIMLRGIENKLIAKENCKDWTHKTVKKEINIWKLTTVCRATDSLLKLRPACSRERKKIYPNLETTLL